MVKLDFSKFVPDFENEDALLQHEENEKSKKSKFFTPGLHEVVIKSVSITKNDDQGQPLKDDRGNPVVSYCKAPNDTWLNMKVTFEGVGGKTINEFISIPTRTQKWKTAAGGETMFMYLKFKAFCLALGINASTETLSEVLVKYFANPACLEGLKVAVKVGHKGVHGEIVSRKSDPEGLRIRLVDAGGKPLLDSTGKEIVATSDEALKAYCMTSTPPIRYEGFMNVLEYSKAATPNSFIEKEIEIAF